MAIQVIKAPPKAPTFAQKLNLGVGRGLEMGQQLIKEHEQKQNMQSDNERYKGLTGHNLSKDPNIRKMEIEYALKGQNQAQEMGAKLKGNQQILRNLEQSRGLEQGSLSAYESDPKMAEIVSRPPKESKTPLSEKPVPKETVRQIKKILADNPEASSDTLRSLMDEAGILPYHSNPYTENRRRTEEQVAKTSEDRRKALRQETLPIRTELAKKAQSAEKGIQNKEQLLELIEKGDINDPTFATLAEALPLNLGKRLLSKDTVEYKGGLVEEFGDLRNIFQGQTKIKEIDLLENKIADIYLTDEQKKAVLRSRITALKADVIRAEAAAELEDREDLGVLQFNNELEKIVKPKLEALFNQILDEQKSIIQNAENRKKVPLNINDADDKKIIEQIFIEAGKNWKEAEKLAKKKGYTW